MWTGSPTRKETSSTSYGHVSSGGQAPPQPTDAPMFPLSHLGVHLHSSPSLVPLVSGGTKPFLGGFGSLSRFISPRFAEEGDFPGMVKVICDKILAIRVLRSGFTLAFSWSTLDARSGKMGVGDVTIHFTRLICSSCSMDFGLPSTVLRFYLFSRIELTSRISKGWLTFIYCFWWRLSRRPSSLFVQGHFSLPLPRLT